MSAGLSSIRWYCAILLAVVAPLLSPAVALPWLLGLSMSIALIGVYGVWRFGGRQGLGHTRVPVVVESELSGLGRHSRRVQRCFDSVARLERYRYRVLLLSTLLVIACTQALLWQAQQLPSSCIRQTVQLAGQINDFPVTGRLPDGTAWQRFQMTVTDIDVAACSAVRQLRATVYGELPNLNLGDVLTTNATLRPVPSQWSPGVLPEQARYAANGIDALASGSELIAFHADQGRSSINAMRRALHSRLLATPVSPTERGLLLALVLGNGSVLAADIWQVFQRLGVSHVLVISGLHVGLVAAALWWLASLGRRLICWPGDCGGVGVNVAAAVVGAALYAALAGFSLPTLRALAMLCSVLGVLLLGWRVAPWRGLYLAVLLILLVNPFAALSSSLWMSAGATAVLLWLATRQASTTTPRDRSSITRALLHVGMLLRLQLYLGLLMLPVTLFWFSMASISAVISNLLIVPIVTFWIVPLALLGALGSCVSAALATLLWQLAVLPVSPGLALLTAMDAALSDSMVLRWQLSLVDVGLWCLFAVVVRAVLPLVSGVAALRWPLAAGEAQPRLASLHYGLARVAPALMRKRSLAAVLAFTIMLQYRLSLQPNPNDVVITLLDIGQGTAVVVQNEGQTLLYDTGGGVPGLFTQADKIIVPFLRQAHVTSIDTLVLSHGDFDHAGGRDAIADAMGTGKHYGFAGSPCRAGEIWPWTATVTITTLSGTGQAHDQRNDDSCVLLVEAYGRRFLLAGDISSRRERELVRYWRQALRADVLLVGHHGSQSSTGATWLKWVAPSRAAISVGRGNRFGHPAAQVSERLRAGDIAIDNTAVQGTVTYTVERDGTLQVRSMRTGWTPFWLAI